MQLLPLWYSTNNAGPKTTRGQPVLIVHWTGALSSFQTEEDTPPRHGTVRKTNMNPKNIGSYMEGEGGRGRKEEKYRPSGKD